MITIPLLRLVLHGLFRHQHHAAQSADRKCCCRNPASIAPGCLHSGGAGEPPSSYEVTMLLYNDAELDQGAGLGQLVLFAIEIPVNF